MEIVMSVDEKELLKRIGKNISNYRKKKDLTQVQFAELIEMNRSALARIEAGGVNSSIIRLSKIAIELDITIEELVRVQVQ